MSRPRCARRLAVKSLDTGLPASTYHSVYSGNVKFRFSERARLLLNRFRYGNLPRPCSNPAEVMCPYFTRCFSSVALRMLAQRLGIPHRIVLKCQASEAGLWTSIGFIVHFLDLGLCPCSRLI